MGLNERSSFLGPRRGGRVCSPRWRTLARSWKPGEQEVVLAFLTERHGLVNVNAANAEELVALGLSKKDADTIGTYRTEHGPFADFAALHSVPGLDVDRLNAVRERVAFRD